MFSLINLTFHLLLLARNGIFEGIYHFSGSFNNIGCHIGPSWRQGAGLLHPI